MERVYELTCDEGKADPRGLSDIAQYRARLAFLHRCMLSNTVEEAFHFISKP